MNITSHPVKPSQVTVSDHFLGRYMELVRTKAIPYQWEALNDRIPGAAPSYTMYNFRAAAGLIKGEHKGHPHQDSDFAKWLEAVAYVLMWNPDPDLEKTADEAIDLICAAQQSDGYLNSYYILTGLDKRWTNLLEHHELYCLGHMIEAAVAYYQATGKDKFLNAIIRYVDLVDKTFGSEPDKLHGYPGHPVIELALIKLYDITGNEKHLKLAKYFVDERGQGPLYFKNECEKYDRSPQRLKGFHKFQIWQAGLPVREQKTAQGHAVRATYLYSGMTDVARKTQDAELLAACEALWQNITERQMYITGSIGASPFGEAFSFDYDLPNDTAYAETCAAIGLVFFARRMLEVSLDSQYSDVMERALYNGIISGIALDGQSFFYVNPLEARPEASLKDYNKKHVKVERQKWFSTSCCPPNISRLLASIGSYAYTVNDQDDLFVHLYLGGVLFHTAANHKVKIETETDYPWEGDIKAVVSPEVPVTFTYALRIPGWCRHYSVKVNENEISEQPLKGYLRIRREWKAGDTVTLHFDMPVTVNAANPAVRADIGKAAITRGPVVYCIEEADNGPNLHLFSLGDHPDFQVKYEKDILGGVTVITGEGQRLSGDWPEHTLYQEAPPLSYSKQRIIWIPYFAWANRKPGEMIVWVNKLPNLNKISHVC
ncbi:hypothetical protein FACS189447_00280 [Spirochaetia bacterium]|nr:hypothetical protein FACS189447_00280 [Spirochaetia bacterium]